MKKPDLRRLLCWGYFVTPLSFFYGKLSLPKNSVDRYKIFSLGFFILSLVLFFPFFANAQSIQTANISDQYFRMGGGLSMGGAYRALADSPSGLIYNPAGVTSQKGVMEVSGDYAYQGDVGSHMYGASVSDFQTSPKVGYGLSFHRFTPTIGGVKATVMQTIIGAGYSLGSFMQIGFSGKGYMVNLNSASLRGPRGLDMDVGALIHPISSLSIGVTGYNVIRGKNIEEFPLMLGLGAALVLKPHFKLSADAVKNFKTPATSSINYYFGSEIRVAESMFLRGGFAFDNVVNNNSYSVGTAIQGPKANLVFTFSQRLSPSSETYAASAEFKF